MKKFLLSAVSVMACMGMSAAIPQLQDQFNGSIEVKQEVPGYSNPSAYDADGNLIMTGSFNGTFGAFDAIGTSAYIVKYDKTNKEAWKVAITGAATVTSVDTDKLGNIYVAGTFADEVEVGSVSGAAKTITGVGKPGSYVEAECAAFIAKYDKDGNCQSVETFVPTESKEGVGVNKFTYFKISKISVFGDKVYAAAVFTGVTEKDGEKYEGVLYDLEGWGFMFSENASGAIISMSASDLSNCKKECYFISNNATTLDGAEQVYSVSLAVSDSGVFAGFSGHGKFTAQFGSNVETVDLSANNNEGYNEFGYVFGAVSEAKKPVALRTMSTTMKFIYLTIGDMVVNGNSLYAASSYIGADAQVCYMPQPELPAADAGVAPVNKASRVFVSEINLGDFSLVKSTPDTESAGADEGGVEYCARVRSMGCVDGALYLNEHVSDYAVAKYSGIASRWFDGSAFSAAPVAATGIAVGSVDGNGVVALPSSTAAALDYKTFTFTQTGIENIGADFDENAPVEYFNLQGIRVANPENGLYIRRQGNKVEKVIVK